MKSYNYIHKMVDIIVKYTSSVKTIEDELFDKGKPKEVDITTLEKYEKQLSTYLEEIKYVTNNKYYSKIYKSQHEETNKTILNLKGKIENLLQKIKLKWPEKEIINIKSLLNIR